MPGLTRNAYSTHRLPEIPLRPISSIWWLHSGTQHLIEGRAVYSVKLTGKNPDAPLSRLARFSNFYAFAQQGRRRAPLFPAYPDRRLHAETVIFFTAVGIRHNLLWPKCCVDTTGMVRTADPTINSQRPGFVGRWGVIAAGRLAVGPDLSPVLYSPTSGGRTDHPARQRIRCGSHFA